MIKILNNKNFYSLAGLIVIIFSIFSFTQIIYAEVTLWGYAYGDIYESKQDGFTTYGNCQENRALYIQDNPAPIRTPDLCKSYVSTGYPAPNNSYVPIAPKTGDGITFDTEYNLLAPIGDFDKIDTDDIGTYFNRIFLIAIGLAGALAVIMIIIAGVQWMGTDSVFGKTEAKQQITGAVLGLLIALGAYALLNTIDPALLGTKGLSVDQVNIELEEEEIPWSTYSSVGNLTLCPEGFVDVLDGNQGKINVCKTLETGLIKLIADAKKDGIILSGYGSRSTEQQINLRKKNNCPDIENSPAEACKPPTARPGRSMHESGNAVDFRCNGKSMMESGGKNSVCFKWLADKNNNSILKNLASEPWHWSTTGK